MHDNTLDVLEFEDMFDHESNSITLFLCLILEAELKLRNSCSMNSI